ncbi:MAG: cell surface protein SprA [Bacteroidales bacterium]|nr:cell surface protein SprA [Bacteroidales bacterium]
MSSHKRHSALPHSTMLCRWLLNALMPMLMLAGLAMPTTHVQAQADTSATLRMGTPYVPESVKTEVEYDPATNTYTRVKRVGNTVIERQQMDFAEYQDWQMNQLMRQYWQEKSEGSALDNAEGGLLNKIPGFNQISEKLALLNAIPKIDIKPSGSAELTFQVINNYRKDPQLDATKRSVTTFDFDLNLQINLHAKIGDLFEFDINQNTQATFDFENKIKLKYEGKEDDIVQLAEAADISFPLTTTLIKGSQQLFGFHTKLKFGKLMVDAVVSHKETSTENVQVKGGASSHEFQIRADEYEENRHFFIAQYFYDNYNRAMSTLPVVNSNVRILRLEVWRTNVGAAVTQNRNILALTDLGEYNPSNTSLHSLTRRMPDNNSNDLLLQINPSAVRSINSVTSYMQGLGMTGSIDYEKIESARLLNSNEYTFNSQLGFISLNQPLSNDQVLAVAFQYQVVGDTNVYQVGELTTDGINDPQTLIVKLIKGTAVNPRGPLWRLMMKNVYFLKSSQISADNFRLNILYEDPEAGLGVGYFTEGPREGTPLIEVFGLDRMDAIQSNYYADGVFDWFDSAAFKGGLIQSTTGRIYFPTVEPFGKDLRQALGNNSFADQYCYDSLYTMTRALAQQYADRNKFYLEGYYTTNISGEISLGYSVTQGSVSVTAGGVPLIENVDYTVDYTMGTVRIINESILSSGTPISVSSENNSFSMTTKRMLGLHLNYEFAPDFNLGATVMNLHEKPMTQKNNFGDEPTSNTIWGLDVNYRHEAPWVTKLVDMLPGFSTKAPSNLSLNAEFAHFIPGMSHLGSSEGSVSYIDDFEGAESSIDLKGISAWSLASTPQDHANTQPMFPETVPGSGLAYGFNRARIAWYRISDDFYNSYSPRNITDDDRSKPYARRIYEQEVFPNKDLAAGNPTNIYEMNLAFYPAERGPYNYDVEPTAYSAGVDADGRLNDPRTRWGGIMRKLDYTDFETQNIETLEFWLMDPFIENPSHSGGKLFINLGDVSEDILRDGRKSFENGLPTSAVVTNVDTTIWGRVPTTQPIVNAFDNDEEARKYQDVGYDGLSSTHGIEDEQSFFADYLNKIALRYGENSQAYQLALADPSSDDFRYFRSSYYDANDVKITDRYKYYNNPEGNSPSDSDNEESYSTAASSYPNVEDINKDNTLSESENYYQYVINLHPDNMVIGQNHIVDIQEARNVQLPNGESTTCKWYQFRIPIREPDQKVGNINGFQSIRFMRMFLNQFDEPIILRFATLDLVYSTWRKYSEDLLQPGDYTTGGNENTTFSISTVNIEENGTRQPVPYILPPGIEREEWYASSNSYTQLNEQSVAMDVDQLASGDARAIYRSTSYDMRHYGHLKLFVHAEKKYQTDILEDNQLALFVRLGNDYTGNYYEYELPLVLTPWYTPSDDAYAIWPEANNVDINLKTLTQIKTNRNAKIRAGEGNYAASRLYTEVVDGKKYTVLGNPNLGKVKVIMIGIRNPKKESLTDGNDMLPKSVIVWLNELRLTEYTDKGGWAAMALAKTNLADLGNLSLYGSYTTAYFGNLEDPLIKEDLVNLLTMQATLDVELGKLLPEKWGWHIPFYLDYNRENGSPEYNPYNPDVLLSDDLATFQTAAERDSVRQMTQQRKSSTNLTLSNVKKNRTSQGTSKTHLYDIENFAFSYAYSRERMSDEETDHYNKDQHRGGLTYSYTLQPKPVKPFDKVKLFRHRNWKIIRDINFYYLPKNLTFSTEMYRDFEETMMRNKSAALVIIKPTYYKQFTWQRNYGLQYDLSRSFHIQYSANASAQIEEPIGRIETRSGSDSIWRSISQGGNIQHFQQMIAANYELPVNKLPYMEFLRMPLSYRTTYNYQGASQALKTLGGTLQSSTTLQMSAQANMTMLYNKIPIVRKALTANSSTPQRNQPRKPQQTKPLTAKDSIAMADSLRRDKWQQTLKQAAQFGLRFIAGVKNINAQYSINSGSNIPGYMGKPMFVGLDPQNAWAPWAGYVLGYGQRIDQRLLDADLLSRDSLFNMPQEATESRTFSMQASLEPLRDFRIELNASQNKSTREEYYYKYLSEYDDVQGPLSYVMTGNYTSTVWSFPTAFTNRDRLFSSFLSNRLIVANRLAEMNNDPYTSQQVLDSTSGEYYPAGYSPNSQTVLLTSFLATYLGHDAGTSSFSPFMRMPLPNWSVNYTGLNKVQFLKKWFTNIALSHRYSSNYTIGNYYTDAALSATNGYDYGSESITNATGDYIAPVSMEGVVMSEQFNPLIRVAVNMVNSMQFNFSIQKNRTLALSFSNNQLTETTREGITVGAGYRIKDVAFQVKFAEKTHNLKSDVVLNLNLTYNNNKTNIRKISQNLSQISSGSEVWMIELSAEYALSTAITARAFFQTNINTPFISNAYPNSTTKGGLTIRVSFR